MSNPFTSWTPAMATEHNRRVREGRLAPPLDTAAARLAALPARDRSSDLPPAKTPPRASRGASNKPERELQEEIAAYLRGLRPHCYFVRSRMDRETSVAVGTPDFVGWWQGQPFALEVKRPGCKETREQAGQLLLCRLAGGRAAIVHSLAEAVAFFASFPPSGLCQS